VLVSTSKVREGEAIYEAEVAQVHFRKRLSVEAFTCQVEIEPSEDYKVGKAVVTLYI